MAYTTSYEESNVRSGSDSTAQIDIGQSSLQCEHDDILLTCFRPGTSESSLKPNNVRLEFAYALLVPFDLLCVAVRARSFATQLLLSLESVEVLVISGTPNLRKLFSQLIGVENSTARLVTGLWYQLSYTGTYSSPSMVVLTGKGESAMKLPSVLPRAGSHF